MPFFLLAMARSLLIYLFFFSDQQSEWPEGHRLAASIQFRFPECQKVEFSTIITRASDTGLQLLIDFLLWEAEKRPTAQQALKYPFFHITKRGSDPIHMPISLLTKHQQQQQIQQIRNQNIANDRMSHISLDDSERYSSKDGNYMTRHYSHINGHTHYQQQHQQSNNIHQMNGFKQAMANGDAKDDDYLTDEAEDSMKRTKFENGINSNLTNGELKHYASSMNNNYQSEISAEDANSELSVQLPNTFASVMSDTPLSLTTIQTRHQPPNGHINYNNHDINTITAMNGTKGLNSKMTEHRKDQAAINGFNSRRNSRINDENSAFLNEKISDIFVNRNPGKLYNNNYNAPGSIFNNKLYNGMESVSQNSATRSQDFGYKNKGFFLHDINAAILNGESKVYNIFSKQRQTKPIKYDTNGDSGQEENEYLMMKMPNVQSKKSSNHRKSIATTMHEQDSFEDDELDKLLG